ncbi:MAG: ribonuclease III [Sedimentisphaerales bacterium]|nr:ribonuclease III [Sedimentisphaerales bacterium]
MDKINKIEQILGYPFTDKSLLEKALTHSSQADRRLTSNERLEFFGDSVLSLVICQALFERFPDYLEGDLTKIKSMLVSRRTCARLAARIGIEKFLKIGKGMAKSSALTGSLAAGALEAIIAAIYVDGGFEAARGFILRLYGPLIEQADAQQHQENFKSLLQQHAQQVLNQTPIYELLDEKGPDHNKCFESAVILGDRRFPSAWGTNKKEAEQKAAHKALVELNVIESFLEEDQ